MYRRDVILRRYEVLRPATVEWAMMEALSNPPRGFEMLAREHLWRKKWYILEVVSGWLREGRSPGGLPRHYRGEVGKPLLLMGIWVVAVFYFYFL